MIGGLRGKKCEIIFLKDLDVRCHPAGLHGSKSCPLISFLYNFHWFFPLYIDLVAFLWWPLYVLTMCELWSSLFLFVRMITKFKEVSEEDSWWFHLISVAPFFDHIWKAGPHLICTTAPPLVIILCLIRLSWSSESWFKDFFFWGTSALFLIYDRYIWKVGLSSPVFCFQLQ